MANHLEVWEMERASEGPSASDILWLRWLGKAQKLLGLADLDGNEIEDGYSIDGALEHHKAGFTPEEYAEFVREARAAKDLC